MVFVLKRNGVLGETKGWCLRYRSEARHVPSKRSWLLISTQGDPAYAKQKKFVLFGIGFDGGHQNLARLKKSRRLATATGVAKARCWLVGCFSPFRPRRRGWGVTFGPALVPHNLHMGWPICSITILLIGEGGAHSGGILVVLKEKKAQLFWQACRLYLAKSGSFEATGLTPVCYSQ